VLRESENAFKRFLRDFKAKHRHAGDQVRLEAANGRADLINFGHAREDGEMPVYEHYLRRMRQSGQTNLNLDVLDLLSFPPTVNLYHQLLTYPGAIIPSLDQTLKDQCIALAEADLAGEGGNEADAELSVMDSSIYKIRPFGGERTINMRDLNPGGEQFLHLLP
jgi:DNA replication licensing factor MCM4